MRISLGFEGTMPGLTVPTVLHHFLQSVEPGGLLLEHPVLAVPFGGNFPEGSGPRHLSQTMWDYEHKLPFYRWWETYVAEFFSL